jgi:acyl carrier protein
MADMAENAPGLKERLKQIFWAVFPMLSNEEIEHAGISSIAEWDSVATVTIAALIEEEFSIVFAPDEVEYLLSFDTILDLLRSKNIENGTK